MVDAVGAYIDRRNAGETALAALALSRSYMGTREPDVLGYLSSKENPLYRGEPIGRRLGVDYGRGQFPILKNSSLLRRRLGSSIILGSDIPVSREERREALNRYSIS